MSTQESISAEEVLDRILDLISCVPEAAEALPEGCRTREFWRDVFARNDRTRRLMELFQELPAFANQAPAPGDAAGWRRLMEKDFAGPPAARPKQAADILKHAVALTKEYPPPLSGPRWRDRFGPDEFIQRVRPKESDEYIPNPHRGTTTFQRFQGDGTYASWITSDTHGPIHFEAGPQPPADNDKYAPRTTLTYVRWPWQWLEPAKGKFNWKIVDQSLKIARSRGQTVQLRFQPYTQRVDYAVEPCTARRHPPGTSVNVPCWYWDTGARWLESTAEGASFAPNEPDSNDPRYVKHFGEFIRAFAARYDGHEDLESIDIAYGGFWGEGGGNCTPATAERLTDIYLRSFRKTQLVSMLGTHGCKHLAAKTAGTARHVGWRADCFGDLHTAPAHIVPPNLGWQHTFDAYPMEIERCGVKDAWTAAPVTMETCGNAASWWMEDYDLDVIIREGYRYHMSVYMPKNVFFPAAYRQRLAEFDKKIGYRYALRQMRLPLECKVGQKIAMQFFIDNVGCAPIYRPYKLALGFRQGKTRIFVPLKTDIRTWMPGHTWFEETLTVPKGLKKGEANIDLAIVDRNRPKVWFAIADKTEDGWHPMTSMDVV
jgi:hypothetical protein